MASNTGDGYFRITMYMNINDQGFSESWDLKKMLLADAIIRAKELARIRMHMYKDQAAFCDFVRVSDREVPGFSKAGIVEPLTGNWTPIPSTNNNQTLAAAEDAANLLKGVCNNVECGLGLRFETAGKQKSIRILRAINDYLVAGNVLQAKEEAAYGTMDDDAANVYPGLSDSLSAEGMWQHVKWIKAWYCANGAVYKLDGPHVDNNGDKYYVVLPATIAYPQHIFITGKRNRKTGRVFGVPRGRRVA